MPYPMKWNVLDPLYGTTAIDDVLKSFSRQAGLTLHRTNSFLVAGVLHDPSGSHRLVVWLDVVRILDTDGTQGDAWSLDGDLPTTPYPEEPKGVPLAIRGDLSRCAAEVTPFPSAVPARVALDRLKIVNPAPGYYQFVPGTGWYAFRQLLEDDLPKGTPLDRTLRIL